MKFRGRKNMQKVVEGINYWIKRLPEEYNSMSEKEVSNRPFPNKWSKKAMHTIPFNSGYLKINVKWLVLIKLLHRGNSLHM
jgi:hypothetical protein